MTTSSVDSNGASSSHAAMPNVASLPELSGGQAAGASAAAGGEATARRGSTTVTITEQEAQQHDEVLHLTLRARPSVRWDENVVDNEGLGRKSSKRCCIFHKQRSFGESSTDSSDYDSDRSGSSSVSSAGADDGDKKKRSSRKPRKIARPKKGGKKVPDYQRYHA